MRLPGWSRWEAFPRHPKDPFVQVLSPGEASGRACGWFLWPLSKALDRLWQPDFRGKIVFLEEVDEPPWSIDAHLTHLKQAGLLGTSQVS